MFKYRLTTFALAAVVAAGVVWGAAAQMEAREPKGPAARPRGDQVMTAQNGRVEKLLKNHHGDVDGMLLDGGVEIHFPPHIGRKVTDLIEPGDKVNVQGQQETRPRGEVVFEATQIESQGETIVVDRPQPPRPRGKAPETPMSASGTVKEFATNPHGDIDGLILNDDTEVKLPPHQGQALQDLVKVGDEVRIDGRRHQTPHGDIHLHADHIVAVATGKTLDRDGPDRRPPVPPAPSAKGRDREPEPSNSELLRELTAIRKLLEKQVR